MMRTYLLGSLSLTSLNHLLVKLELLALQNVPVAAAALAGARGNARQQTTTGELIIESSLEGSFLSSSIDLSLEVTRSFNNFLTLLLGCLLHADLDTIVGLVPSAEWGRVDLNNRVLNQCLGSYKLVI